MPIWVSVQPPFPYFTDTDGSALEDGYIWLGEENMNPQTNPVAVYLDDALTQPIAQPIRTRSGYPVINGAIVRLYTQVNYSIQVNNKNGSLIYSAPYSGFAGVFGASNAIGDGAQVLFPLSSEPSSIYINGVYQNKNTYSYGVGGVLFSEAPPLNSSIEFLV
jgi:hypothetical protein